MKIKTLLFGLIILGVNLIKAQIIDPTWKNKIPNYSFEVVTENYPHSSDGSYYCTAGFNVNDYENWIKGYWAEVYEWTHPLRTNSLCTFWHGVAVGTANALRNIEGAWSTYARSGINRGNGDAGEFLVVPLWYGGLESGKMYFVEIFRRGGGSSNVYFSNGQTRQCGNGDVKPPSGSNGIVIKMFEANSSSGWHRTKQYISTLSDLNWMTLGVEGDPGDGTGGGDWDDLRIYEVQPNGCRDNWYFDNTVFNYPLEFFQAGNNIYVGKGLDPEDGINHIAGEVRILNGSHVVLQAGNQIIFGDGFTMEAGGSYLLVENKPCNDNLCPDVLTFSDKLLCDETSMHIGFNDSVYWGTTVAWSPSTHLSDPSSPNPIFTSPGGSGSIDYTVTVTYTCDQGFQFTQTHNVTVQYTNSTDPTATISASNVNSGTYNFSADFELSDGVTEVTITHVGGPPSYQETFYNGVDFSNGFFSWDMEGAYLSSSCHDSQFIIEAINKCTGASESITLQWNKNYPGNIHLDDLPNIIYPPDVGFCFQTVDYADYYEFFAFSPSNGYLYFSNQGSITSNDMCIWHGQGAEDIWGTANVVMYTLTLVNLCGVIREEHGFLNIANGGKSLLNEDDDELSFYRNKEPENIILFPNPNGGIFSVQLPKDNFIGKMVIRDFVGKIVHRENTESNIVILDLELAAGVYTMHWGNSERKEAIRFVVE